MMMQDWDEAINDLTRAAGLEPDDKAIKRKILEAQKKRKAEKKRDKQKYSRLFQTETDDA